MEKTEDFRYAVIGGRGLIIWYVIFTMSLGKKKIPVAKYISSSLLHALLEIHNEPY